MSIDLRAVKLSIDFHLKEVKTVESVARQMKVSPETLRKAFVRQEHISLGDYIVQRKVLAMKEYLLISDAPCYTVCFEFGFREDTGARVFKKQTGMTMRKFREKNRKNNPFK